MNKSDFLDILRDYLKNNFSEYEINDIVRDYEEFFLNGELEGKSDEEIIKGLGSPKAIAQELVSEVKNNSTEANINQGSFNFNNIANKSKAMYKTAKAKTKKFLDSNKIINSSMPTWAVILLLFVIAIFLSPFIIGAILTLIGAGLGLIGAVLAGLAAWGISLYTFSVNVEMAIFFVFLCITGTGVLIAMWTIYLDILKLIKILLIKTISWFKTRFMYVKVKDKKASMSSEIQVENNSVDDGIEKFKNDNSNEEIENVVEEEENYEQK